MKNSQPMIFLRCIDHNSWNCFVIPHFYKDIDRSGAMHISHCGFERQVTAIGYSIVFKNATVNIYQSSFFLVLMFVKTRPFVLFFLKGD